VSRIVYLSSARLPTEKAHGFQVMKMCEAMAGLGHDVDLLHPRRGSAPAETDPFAYWLRGLRLAMRIVDLRRVLHHEETAGLEIDVHAVETNILYFGVRQPGLTVPILLERLKAEGVLMLGTGPSSIRAVTHLDVSKEGIDHAIAVLRKVVH
jgi:hypothetical protein